MRQTDKIRILKQKIDSISGRGFSPQARCARCGKSCIRWQAGESIGRTFKETAKRVDAFIFQLAHEPVHWSVEIKYSDEIQRTGRFTIEEKFVILPDPLPENVSVLADYIWILK